MLDLGRELQAGHEKNLVLSQWVLLLCFPRLMTGLWLSGQEECPELFTCLVRIVYKRTVLFAFAWRPGGSIVS